ncbi:MAG: YihA family ribosome biogenesis GTP-binding protein [Acidobacteria bacterium]|nr:MAG: YihA family ribosome biogenesis GTP-binding protein [Acidobacteriota bacterium]
MKISSTRFVKSAARPDDFPRDQRPEIAFCGRSNVGKSSLLNTLTNVRGLARTSSSPGRTQTINFFLINDSMYFVDLPGYGYAKVSKKVREGWGPMIEDYLRNREQLELAVMLVDSRMAPTDSDVTMKKWLDYRRIPNTVVLTKTDKISGNQLYQALRQGAKTLNTKEIIAFSAVTGAGKDELLARIGAATTSDPTVRKTHL